MAETRLSQKTIVEVTRVFNVFINRPINYGEVLYERDFPDWFVAQAEQRYGWHWPSMLLDLRKGTFFYVRSRIGSQENIVGRDYLAEDDAKMLGERLIQKLAAFASTLPGSESLERSLQLDGFEVNKEKLRLVAIGGPVSAAEEEGRLAKLVKTSGIPDSPTVLKHMADAQSLYKDGKDHPSLNESRNLIQVLIDGISVETNRHGKHSTGLPGGIANRIDYLSQVGFFTADEQAAFKSAWGSLSAGSHPGVPDREQARIGLVLALEFGQILLHKFTNWRVNAYAGFS
jgi:hypothetical protein